MAGLKTGHDTSGSGAPLRQAQGEPHSKEPTLAGERETRVEYQRDPRPQVQNRHLGHPQERLTDRLGGEVDGVGGRVGGG